MPDFVDDDLSFGDDKVPTRVISDADAANNLRAEDINELRRACESLRAHLGGGSGGAVVFDDSVADTNANIRSDRAANQSPIDNTKTGVTNFGSNTVATVGATANYATIGGGDRNVASGDNSTVPGGWRNTASGPNSLAAGSFSTASGDSAIALGSSEATQDYATALGNGCEAFGVASFAAGDGSTASGDSSVAIGTATASGAWGVAIGQGASATVGDNCLALGHNAAAGATDAVAIGHGSIAGAVDAVCIGGGSSQAVGSLAMMGGRVPSATGGYGASFGTKSQATRPTQYAHATGAWLTNGTTGTAGSAQWSWMLMMNSFQSVSPGEVLELFARDSSLNWATGYFTLEDNKVYTLKVTVVMAGEVDVGGTPTRVGRSFENLYLVSRRGGAGTEVLMATDARSTTDANIPSWNFTASVATGPDRIKFEATTGDEFGTCSVLAKIEFLEMPW